jgi:hypothetical protein
MRTDRKSRNQQSQRLCVSAVEIAGRTRMFTAETQSRRDFSNNAH